VAKKKKTAKRKKK